jgi:hypothetical protein
LIGLFWVVLIPTLIDQFTSLMYPEIVVRALTGSEVAALQTPIAQKQ